MTRNTKILSLFQGSMVRFDWNTEGQTITGSPTTRPRLTLGGRAGPSRDISNLAHEMAHFVEIDDQRCMMPGWGLKVPEVWVFNRWCYVPKTHQGTLRECRVAALQGNLLQWAGVKRTPQYLVRSFHFLPDFYFVPAPYTPGDKNRLKWCEDLVQDLIIRPEYSIDYFIAEWRRKQGVLASQLQSL